MARRCTCAGLKLAAVCVAGLLFSWCACTDAQGLIVTGSQIVGAGSAPRQALGTRVRTEAKFVANQYAVKKVIGCASVCSASSSAKRSVLKMAAAPSSYSSLDARLNGGVARFGPVVDQRDCNLCTAIAIVTAAEAAMASKLRDAVPPVKGIAGSLSAADLYFCSSAEKGTRTCSSGWALEPAVMEFVSRMNGGKGLVTQECMPGVVDGMDDSRVCMPDGGRYCSTTFAVARTGKFTWRPTGDESEVMEAIRQNGAVVTRLDIYDDLREFFNRPGSKNKIYSPKKGAQVQEQHAIVLVGYGEENGQRYWIARNSWGPTFANDGYFKILDGQCNILDPANTLIISWQPGPGSPKLRTPKLVPAPGKPGCQLYTARVGDYLSDVAQTYDVDITRLVNDNTKTIKQLGDDMNGKQLLLCKGAAADEASGLASAPEPAGAAGASSAAAEGSSNACSNMGAALEWEVDGRKFCLFSPSLGWDQAQEWCQSVGQGYNLMSLDTLRKYNAASDQLRLKSQGKITHGGAFLLGCPGPQGSDKPADMLTVWTGLHDPKLRVQNGTNWSAVAREFEWVGGVGVGGGGRTKGPAGGASAGDGSRSFLEKFTDLYFTMDAREEEHCIGMVYCANQTNLVQLTKHPCDWKMSFVCEGPAAGA